MTRRLNLMLGLIAVLALTLTLAAPAEAATRHARPGTYKGVIWYKHRATQFISMKMTVSHDGRQLTHVRGSVRAYCGTDGYRTYSLSFPGKRKIKSHGKFSAHYDVRRTVDGHLVDRRLALSGRFAGNRIKSGKIQFDYDVHDLYWGCEMGGNWRGKRL